MSALVLGLQTIAVNLTRCKCGHHKESHCKPDAYHSLTDCTDDDCGCTEYREEDGDDPGGLWAEASK